MSQPNAPAPTFSETRIRQIREGDRKFVAIVESKIRDDPRTLMVDRVRTPDGGSRYEVSDEAGVIYCNVQAWSMAAARDWREGDPEPSVMTRVARALIAVRDVKVIADRLETIGAEALAGGDSPGALEALEDFTTRIDQLTRHLHAKAVAAKSHA